jgi:hypothetical protein
MSLKSHWITHSYTVMPDRRNGGTMMRITFVNMATQITADTYICPSNRNAKNWTEILQNHHLAHILGGLELKKSGNTTIISADSKPVIHWEGDRKVLEQKLKSLWAPKNNFGDLFE